MPTLNKVFLSGKLTKKPELRKTPGGTPVTDLLIALNREFCTVGGDKHREVCFVDVVVWGKSAESCVKSLFSSSSVLVEGRLQLDTWMSKEGDRRCKLRVAAEKVQFLDPRGPLDSEGEVQESQELLI